MVRDVRRRDREGKAHSAFGVAPGPGRDESSGSPRGRNRLTNGFRFPTRLRPDSRHPRRVPVPRTERSRANLWTATGPRHGRGAFITELRGGTRQGYGGRLGDPKR